MSLRTSLASLRKDFGAALVADKTNVTLQAATDLQQFERETRRASLSSLSEHERVEALRRAVEVYGGPLLPGLYDDWIFPERDRLAEEQRTALSALARWHELRGEPVRALDFARRATLLAPLDEDLRCELIRLLKETGQIGEARRQFEDLTRLLEDQLGVKPSHTTCTLVEGLSDCVPRAPVSARRMVSLPLSRGRFRGRRDELSALVQRLAGGKSDAEGTRLFTLFGPGGIGKTRLAIEAARRLVAHGLLARASFVTLAGASTSEQVWDGIFAALDKTRAAGLSPQAQLAAYLGTESCLLILDNVEQVALEAGEVAAALLGELPGLVLLTTSRRRLGTPEEALVAVGALSNDDGVGLFVDRARSVVPEFSPAPEERTTLSALVTRLEGFPLAIELAAAWSSVMTPAEILTQLERGLLELPEGSSGPDRQRSLTAMIQWSVSLLSPTLQKAFFALSVFRGGCFSDAANEICGVDRDALASLRDRSLIAAQAHGDQVRFSLHEALREFGALSLAAQETASLQRAHVAYFRQLALQETSATEKALELANFRQATQTASKSERGELCLALASFWDDQGHWREGRRCLEEALSHEPREELRVGLLHAIARLCFHLSDFEAATHYHLETLESAKVLGDDRRMGQALLGLAATYAHQLADYDRTLEFTTQAQTHFERAGYVPGQCACLVGLGTLATIQERFDEAIGFQTEALQRAQQAAAKDEQAAAHHRLGISFHSVKDAVRSEEHLRLAEALMVELNNPTGLASVRNDLGTLAKDRGDLDVALVLFQEALHNFRELGEFWSAAICQANLARMAHDQGALVEAAQYWHDSLQLRCLLRDPHLLATGLDGATNLFFTLAARNKDGELGAEAVAFRASSARWRTEHHAGSPDPAGHEEEEAQVRTLLDPLASSQTMLTLEQAANRALELLAQ